MGLKEYLHESGIYQKDLAEFCDVTEEYVWMLLNGNRNPSLSLSKKIFEFTKGNVPIHAFRKCNSYCYPGCPCSQGKKK